MYELENHSWHVRYVFDDQGPDPAGPDARWKRHTHNFIAVNKKLGGLHVWCNTSSLGLIGGVEMHYANAPEWMDDSQILLSHHEHCWVIDGECYHDGSNLTFEEYWKPTIEDFLEDQCLQKILQILRVVATQADQRDW